MKFAVLGAVMAAVAIGSGSAAAEPSNTGAASAAAAVEAVTRSGAEAPAAQAPSALAEPPARQLKTDAAVTGEMQGATAPPAATVAAPPPPPPVPTLLAEIDLTRQRMTVIERGTVKHTWPISSGREGYRTPAGSFRPAWMAKMWYSKQYDDAPMPHAVFFNGGIAVHATQATGMLGRPASHGCIRLAPSNAATFYALVTQHSKAMTRIKVFGTAPSAPVASKRAPRDGLAERGPGRDTSRYSRYDAPPRAYAPPRYSYNSYGRAYGSAPSPRLVYPGDPLPYGYRPARSPYRPYGGPRVYYVD